MLIIGLTGGVASGKSIISKVLKEEGAYLIDTDQIARELVEPETPTWKELVRVFGKEILQEDGSIHRKKLASKVFSDPEQKSLLDQIIHPRIKEEIDRHLERIARKDPEAIVIIDAPLLVEIGNHREMDKVIVVTSTEKQQIERLREREGINQKGAQRIIASQMPTQEKVKVADFVIQNEGSLEEVERKAKEVFQELKRVALQKKGK
jgi:dephospho-CoA kinase